MSEQKPNQAKIKCPICGKELNDYYCGTCGWFDVPIIGSIMTNKEKGRIALSKKIYEKYQSDNKSQSADIQNVKGVINDEKVKQLNSELIKAKNKLEQLETELKRAKESNTQVDNNVSKANLTLIKPVAFLKAEYNNHEQYFALYEGINTFGCETINDNVPDMHNEISLPGDFGLAKKQFEIKITPNKTELTAYAGCNLSRSGSLSNGDTFTTTTNDKTITYKFTF